MTKFYKGSFPTDGKADPRMKSSYPWVGLANRGGFFLAPWKRRGVLSAQ